MTSHECWGCQAAAQTISAAPDTQGPFKEPSLWQRGRLWDLGAGVPLISVRAPVKSHTTWNGYRVFKMPSTVGKKKKTTRIQIVQIKHPNCYRKVVYFICKLRISGKQKHSSIVYEAPTHRVAFYLCADTVRTEMAICADKCFRGFEL